MYRLLIHSALIFSTKSGSSRSGSADSLEQDGFDLGIGSKRRHSGDRSAKLPTLPISRQSHAGFAVSCLAITVAIMGIAYRGFERVFHRRASYHSGVGSYLARNSTAS